MSPQNEKEPLEGEVVEPRLTPPATEEQTAQTLLDPSKNKNGIFIGTLNLVAAPMRALTKPLHKHYHRRYHSKYTHAKKIFILDIFLLFSALVLLAFSLYFFLASPYKNYLNISLKDSTPFTIGANNDLNFLIFNNTKKNLDDLNLTIESPSSLILKKFPANFNQQTSSIKLGLLKAKDTVNLSFQAQIWGEIEEKQKIIFRAKFFDGKKQEEQIEILEIPLSQSSLAIDWSAPKEIKIGQNLNLTINYKNNSSETLSKVILWPAWPADFNFVSSNAELREGRIILNNVPARANGQIRIAGFLASWPSTRDLGLSLQSFLEDGGKQFLQSSLLKTLEVKKNDLDLKFKVEGEKTFFKPDEQINLILEYKNQGTEEIKDLSFEISLPPQITADGKGLFIVDKKSLPELSSLPSQKTGLAALSFKTSPAIGGSAILEKNFSMELRPLAKFYLASQPTELLRSFSPPRFFKFSTSLKLHAEARYFTDEGDQLGRGPLPPQANKTTKYWINWFITASPNSVKDLTIKGHLPLGVSWTGKTNATEGEAVQYDPVTRNISWKNWLIEATEGNACPCVSAGFEVAVTPRAENIGEVLNLVDNLKITGTDAQTKEYIEKTTENLTTNLLNDQYARGKGVVQE